MKNNTIIVWWQIKNVLLQCNHLNLNTFNFPYVYEKEYSIKNLVYELRHKLFGPY